MGTTLIEAELVIDEFDGVNVTTKTTTLPTFEEAQARSIELSGQWEGEGFVKYHDCWHTPGHRQWRQKTIVYRDVEYTEEDGDDE